MRHRLVSCCAAMLLAFLPACGDDHDSVGPAAPVTVVATTTHVADLVRAVGGDRVDVVGLIPANADPHDYEVRPRDVKALADARLVVRSGGDLDGWLADAIAGSGTDAVELTLIDSVRTLATDERGAGAVDPHWWQDPRNGARAITAIRAALTRADPAGATAYDRAAAAYSARLAALDAAIATCIGKVPAADRKLVTTHDALGYYADRFGIEVVGAVIPSLSTQGQASAGETARLVELIRREQVSAVFAESSVNAKVEQAIARAANARFGARLWADSLGPAGSDGATYLRALAANTRALVDGFTDGRVRCELPG